jgi:hypothetical protein
MKEQKHMCLDIETMDTGSTAGVVAIGARIFTIDGPSKGFEAFIDPNLAEHFGTVSNETMEWWHKQPAFDLVFGGKLDPADAVFRFIEFVKLHKPDTVWANSPEFDIAIMRHLCKQVAMVWPFHFRDARDCRTLFRLGEAMKIDVRKYWDNPDRQAHNPLDDATKQAEVTAAILKVVLSSPASDSGPGSFPLPSARAQPAAPRASTEPKIVRKSALPGSSG